MSFPRVDKKRGPWIPKFLRPDPVALSLPIWARGYYEMIERVADEHGRIELVMGQTLESAITTRLGGAIDKRDWQLIGPVLERLQQVGLIVRDGSNYVLPKHPKALIGGERKSDPAETLSAPCGDPEVTQGRPKGDPEVTLEIPCGDPVVDKPAESFDSRRENKNRERKRTEREQKRDPEETQSAPPTAPAGPVQAELIPALADSDRFPPPKPLNAFDTALAAFCVVWQDHYGQRYLPTKSDRANLGRLLNDTPAELVPEIPDAFRAYLADTDKWLSETQRHSLTWFCTKGGGLNKYRVKARTVGFSQREINGAQAAQRWLERKAAEERARPTGFPLYNPDNIPR